VTTDVVHVAAGIWTPTLPDATTGSFLLDTDAGVQSLSTSSGWDPVTGLGAPGSSFLDGLGS
jgi:hypothetical protein